MKKHLSKLIAIVLVIIAVAFFPNTAYGEQSTKLSVNHTGIKTPAFRLIEEKEPFYSTKYTYGKDGKLQESVTCYQDEPEWHTYYYYSPSGMLVEKKEEEYDGITLYFHYDSKGTEIEKDDTGGVGSQANAGSWFNVEERYDSEGRIMTFTVKPQDGEPYSPLEYRYDGKGRILSLSSKDMQITYRYAKNGSFTRTAQYDFRNDELVEEYDSSGHIIKSCWMENGKATSTVLYKYDAQGKLLEMKNGSWWRRYTYEQDAYGNITAKTETDSSGSKLRTEYLYEKIAG